MIGFMVVQGLVNMAGSSNNHRREMINPLSVPAAEIRVANYDLSLNRYQKRDYKEANYDPPKVIIARMKALTDDITNHLAKLEEMLG